MSKQGGVTCVGRGGFEGAARGVFLGDGTGGVMVKWGREGWGKRNEDVLFLRTSKR